MASRSVFELTARCGGMAAANARDWLCQYRGKMCTNPRTIRLDGQLHHLCEMHRERANYNQRMSVTRRKLARLVGGTTTVREDNDDTSLDVLWNWDTIAIDGPLEIISYGEQPAESENDADAATGVGTTEMSIEDESSCTSPPAAFPSIKEVVDEFHGEELEKWLLEVADIEQLWEELTQLPAGA